CPLFLGFLPCFCWSTIKPTTNSSFTTNTGRSLVFFCSESIFFIKRKTQK
ncbi:unnamed protein product, partial [Brassica oleracea]